MLGASTLAFPLLVSPLPPSLTHRTGGPACNEPDETGAEEEVVGAGACKVLVGRFSWAVAEVDRVSRGGEGVLRGEAAGEG